MLNLSLKTMEESDSENSQLEQMSSKAKPVVKPVRKRKTVMKGKHQMKPHQKQFRSVLMSLCEEQQMLEYLRRSLKVVDAVPQARFLYRMLTVRKLQRENNIPTLEDRCKKICLSMDKDVYESKTALNQQVGQIAGDHVVSFFNVVGYPAGRDCPLPTLLNGGDYFGESFRSPYTCRVLKPCILQTFDIMPPKLQLLQEIAAFPHRNDPSWQPPPHFPIVFCYVRPYHIPVLNAYCKEFFWPAIDLSEYLGYPDFSCVALYRKAVVGFAFMVPDVKPNEAYIPFIFVLPHWRKAGIARFMLYHLFQTCMGKEITLHVAIDNPAVLLYQRYGFKIESQANGYYDKYLPTNFKGCRHAFFMRLSK